MTSAAVGGRYVPLALLGRGATGRVFRARDLLIDGEVALKRLDPAARLQHRREVAALRLLRLPGVVELLDEGRDADGPYVVLELVEGDPFPSAGRPWATLDRSVRSLLMVLESLHALGVVHGDLKPSNVFVGRNGRVTLLDFGLTAGEHFDGPRDRLDVVAGTGRYLSPERLLGAPPSQASDVFAAGVLVHEALRGRGPYVDSEGRAAAVYERVGRRPERLADHLPELPEAVSAALDAMLAPVGLRPGVSALLRALAPSSVRRRSGPRARREDVADLLAGPDRLLHLREDAVELLLRTSGGDGGRVNALLDDWVTRGVAHDAGDGRLRVDRDALARATLDPALFDADATAAARLPRVLAAVDRHLQGGRGEPAASLLNAALLEARRSEDGAAADALLEAWTVVALDTGTRPAVDRLLHELGRSRESPFRAPLLRLARAWWATDRGDGERAIELLGPLPSLLPRRLQRWWFGVRVWASRRCDAAREEAVVAQTAREAMAAAIPHAPAEVAGWLGKLRYRQGRYEEAATLHLRAAERPGAGPRLAALLHAASAWLEAGRFEEAIRLARGALETAKSRRHTLYEARAEWVLRAAAYRSGATLTVDEELADASRRLKAPAVAGLILTTEAAVAHRAGSPLAAALAEDAADAWDAAGRPVPAALARSLARAHGAPANTERLIAVARSPRTPPGIALQILALLAVGEGEQSCDAPGEATTIAARVGGDPFARREVLSTAEAMDALGVPMETNR